VSGSEALGTFYGVVIDTGGQGGHVSRRSLARDRREKDRHRSANAARPVQPAVEADPPAEKLAFDTAHLFADESDAFAERKDVLRAYVDQQGSLEALRLREATEPPWPAAENPMLGYLVARSAEMAVGEGADAAIAWLAAHAWFEGAIAERSRFARHLDTD
jgi:hypothetical protein